MFLLFLFLFNFRRKAPLVNRFARAPGVDADQLYEKFREVKKVRFRARVTLRTYRRSVKLILCHMFRVLRLFVPLPHRSYRTTTSSSTSSPRSVPRKPRARRRGGGRFEWSAMNLEACVLC